MTGIPVHKDAAALDHHFGRHTRDPTATDLVEVVGKALLVAALDLEAVDGRLKAIGELAILGKDGDDRSLVDAGIAVTIHRAAVPTAAVEPYIAHQRAPGCGIVLIAAHAAAVDDRAQHSGAVGVDTTGPDALQFDRRVDDRVLQVKAQRVGEGVGEAGIDNHQRLTAGVIGVVDGGLDRPERRAVVDRVAGIVGHAHPHLV